MSVLSDLPSHTNTPEACLFVKTFLVFYLLYLDDIDNCKQEKIVHVE